MFWFKGSIVNGMQRPEITVRKLRNRWLLCTTRRHATIAFKVTSHLHGFAGIKGENDIKVAEERALKVINYSKRGNLP